MVLNPDCIRDVLIAVEKMQKFKTTASGEVTRDDLFIEALYDVLPTYGREDIFYTLFSLDQAGLVNISAGWAEDCVSHCVINYLTFSGHEFLAKIRDIEQWHGIKKALPVIRNYSLDAINAISQGMTSGAISAYLEKNR